jgi:hypothetical protein
MNTIQITTVDGTINYTENEVVRFIERAKDVDIVQHVSDEQRAKVTTICREVRDFFSEGEWNDGEQTINKSDVNELLEKIGCNKLTTRYNATFTITGTFTVECEDEGDAEAMFTDNVDVSFYDGDIDVDQIDVMDIEATE